MFAVDHAATALILRRRYTAALLAGRGCRH